MRNIVENYIMTFTGGICLIVFGVYNLRKIINNKEEKSSYIKVSAIFNGIFGSIGFIFCGLGIIYCKMTGKF